MRIERVKGTLNSWQFIYENQKEFDEVQEKKIRLLEKYGV